MGRLVEYKTLYAYEASIGPELEEENIVQASTEILWFEEDNLNLIRRPEYDQHFKTFPQTGVNNG